jgi:hypothetical protein
MKKSKAVPEVPVISGPFVYIRYQVSRVSTLASDDSTVRTQKAPCYIHVEYYLPVLKPGFDYRELPVVGISTGSHMHRHIKEPHFGWALH